MEKIKHNHCLTDILKVSLFSLLMLAPLLASVSQMLYVTLNKNAKDSYYGQTINQTQINIINSNSDFKLNTLYTYIVDSNTVYQNNNLTLNVTNFNMATPTLTDSNLVTTINIQYESNQNRMLYTFRKSDNTSAYLSSVNNFSFTFELLNIPSNVNNEFYQYMTYQTYNKYSYLDNAFYYGVNQMTQSDLFNWTQNTGIYTGVHAMTSGIGIESIFIPMLLTYWLVLTIVYIIIDVVIETFKYLTHMLQNKVKSKTS